MDRRTAYAGEDIAPGFVPEECNSRLCDDVIKTITQHGKSDEKDPFFLYYAILLRNVGTARPVAGTTLVIDRLFDDTSVRLINFFVPLRLFSAPELSEIKRSLANASEIKKNLDHLNGHKLILFSKHFPVSSNRAFQEVLQLIMNIVQPTCKLAPCMIKPP
jgi:hypothetical protein